MTFKKLALITALLITSITAAAAAPGYPQDTSWNYSDQGADGGGAAGN